MKRVHGLPAVRLAVTGLALVATQAAAGQVPQQQTAAGQTAQLQPTAFGRGVAISGDVAFVAEPGVGGARGVPGLVHLYRRLPTGWKEAEKLKSPATAPGDGFGSGLVSDGTTLLVAQLAAPAPAGRGRAAATAASVVSPPPPSDPGSVQTFRRGADGKWTSSGTLRAPSPVAGAEFGAGLAISADLVAVGAPGEAAGGSVYLFRKSQSGQWPAPVALTAQGLAAGDRFGDAIAIDGDRLAVGAPGREGKGAVFLFHRAPDGSWSPEIQTPVAIVRTLPDRARLGSSLVLKGDRLVAGAPGVAYASSGAAGGRGAPGGGGGRAGAVGGAPGVAVIFQRRPDSRWFEQATLAPFDVSPAARFGESLALVGDEVWIGAPGSEGVGRIYRARRDRDGSWSGMTKLVVDSIDSRSYSNAQFAASFAVSGDVAVVGMPGDGAGGGTVAFLAKAPATGVWNFKSTTYPAVAEEFAAASGSEIRCNNGKAREFDCNNTSIVSYVPLSAMGAKRGIRLSAMWGWTDPVTGDDIAIMGRSDGVAFIRVTDPLHPVYLGDMLRTQGANIAGRELKTYKNYVLVVSDGSGGVHGVQFFDLTRLRGVKTPRRWTESSHYDLGNIHTIAVNEESGYAYANAPNQGPENCGGGFHIINIKDPLHPTFAGCFADQGTGRRGNGTVHDAQCVMYRGPDKRFTGKEICIAANETALSIQDVTDKKNIKVISRATYPDVYYAHQGWFTEDQKYWYEDDELDEGGFNSAGANCPCGKAKQGTRTLVWDMSDLTDPVLAKEFIGSTHATDHNQYVKGNRLYQGNYRAGLRIIDISDPVNPREAGWLDTYPADNNAEGGGSWNPYPYFKNGVIGVVSSGEGLFMVRDRTASTVP